MTPPFTLTSNWSSSYSSFPVYLQGGLCVSETVGKSSVKIRLTVKDHGTQEVRKMFQNK